MLKTLAVAAAFGVPGVALGASAGASDPPRTEQWARLVDVPAGVVVRYPPLWSASADRQVPQFVLASYPLRGRAASFPEPGRTLPADGAFVALFVSPVALMVPGERRNYPERPPRLSWSNATGNTIEGFGPGRVFRFRANGYGVTAQIALGARASRGTRAQALGVVASLHLTPLRQRAQTIRVGGAPTGIAFARGAAWVALGDALVRIDSVTRKVTQRIALPPGGDYRHVAIAGGQAWVTDGAGPRSEVVAVDLAKRRVRRVVKLRCCAIGVAARGGDVWVTVPREGPGEVVRIDARSGRVVARIPVGPGPGPIAIAGGRIWLWNTSYPTSLMGIDPATNRVVAVGDVRGVSDLDAGPAGLWAAGNGAGVVRLDPHSGRVVRHTSSISGARQLAVGRAAVYTSQMACGACSASFVTRTDLASGSSGPPLPVGAVAIDLVVGGGALWVANFGSATVTRIPISPP
jgi:hypothetical protein